MPEKLRQKVDELSSNCWPDEKNLSMTKWPVERQLQLPHWPHGFMLTSAFPECWNGLLHWNKSKPILEGGDKYFVTQKISQYVP